MNKCKNAEYRFGTTGTLDGTETNKLVLEGLFGMTHKVIATRDLQVRGTLAGLDINVLLLRYHNDVCHMMKSYASTPPTLWRFRQSTTVQSMSAGNDSSVG